MGPARYLIAVLPMLAVTAAPAPAADTPPEAAQWGRCITCSPETGEEVIDPVCFFEMLIARYRCLEAYEDIARVIQITERSGERPLRVETMIGCEIQDGRLLVETPGSQIRRTVGLDVHFRSSPAMEETELNYNMWLAPHMALRFAEEPRDRFRPGTAAGLTPIEAESVTVDEKPMVHLQLESGEGQPRSDEARFDLYVNPDSMLIERITGQERLPDGASYETRLEITPLSAENAGGDGPQPPGPMEPPAPPAAAPMQPAEPVEPPAGLGRSTDVGPQAPQGQPGGSAAPPTSTDAPADPPPPAVDTPGAKPPASAPPEDPSGGRGTELGRPGDANLTPPAKVDEAKPPPVEVESKDHGPAAEEGGGRSSSAPPKPGQSPPARSAPPPTGNATDFVGL
jgi:hypothetical protein